ERRQRLGRDADVGRAARRVFGDLHRVALVQLDLHFRKARSEIANDRRQHVARLRMRRGDRKLAVVLVAVFRSHSPDTLYLSQLDTTHRRNSRPQRPPRIAVAMTASPAGVMDAMRLPARTKTRTPSSSSSWRTCLLTPGCEVKSAAAASDTLRPWSAIAQR